jgi:hypothetical protein
MATLSGLLKAQWSLLLSDIALAGNPAMRAANSMAPTFSGEMDRRTAQLPRLAFSGTDGSAAP